MRSKQISFIFLQATFFINGISMSSGHGVGYAAENRKKLYKVVEDGHDLGDHSLNHMKVNSVQGDQAACSKPPVDIDVKVAL